MVQNLLKHNSVLICVWCREISLKSHLSDPLLSSQSSDRGNLSRRVRLIAPVRDRSGTVQVTEVEISHPWNSNQSCHDFCNSSLPCSTFQAHYFWHATTSAFLVGYPHAAFATHLFWHLQTPSAILIPSLSQRLTKALKSCLISESSDGPMRTCWLCKVLSAGNNVLFFPLSSLWNKCFLPWTGRRLLLTLWEFK